MLLLNSAAFTLSAPEIPIAVPGSPRNRLLNKRKFVPDRTDAKTPFKD